MKLWFFVISLVLIAHANGVGELLVAQEEPAHVETALAIRCDDLETEGDLRRECVDRYASAFDSGEIEPIAVLRMHCTRWHNPWEDSRGEPPLLCVEQFGGWVAPKPS
jgi:hypothetical protein